MPTKICFQLNTMKKKNKNKYRVAHCYDFGASPQIKKHKKRNENGSQDAMIISNPYQDVSDR